MFEVEIRCAMDNAFLTGIFTLGGVLLGFLLTQVTAATERNREQIKKLRSFQRRLLILSITPHMLIDDLDSRGDFSKMKCLYDESEISVKIRGLADVFHSIDFKDEDISNAYVKFEIVRHYVEEIKQAFVKYETREIYSLDIFYSELDRACKNLINSIIDLDVIIRGYPIEYSIYGRFRRRFEAFFH